MACSGTGVASLPHAGEIAPRPGGGADSVRGAAEALGAARIGHGVLAADDAGLLAQLASQGVCLDVCPTSNHLLGVVPSLARHPLPALLAEPGLAVSIGSDDPLLFGASLADEYEACRTQMGLDDEALARCAAASFTHARAPPALVRRGLEGVAAWLAL